VTEIAETDRAHDGARYTIAILPVGLGDVPGPELFWMRDFDQWHTLQFQVMLITGPGITALVNTGPARDLTSMNDGWAAFLGERARLRREPGEFVLDHLARLNIDPADITHVILTPLQLYTVSNVLAFPNAQICLSKRGWLHFHTTHEHPHDDRATSIPDDILAALVTDAWPRVRLLEEEDEIAPGLRTWWSGGHHRASLAVEVDTGAGTVAISDSYFVLANVERNHPIGINESFAEIFATYARVRETADIVLPLYDPDNLRRFPTGVIG